MATKQFKIPVDVKGNLVMYGDEQNPNGYINRDVADWIDHEPFVDTLLFDTVFKGDYSTRYVFARSNGAKVSMTMKEFNKAIKFMDRGILKGEFRYTKNHYSFGVAFIREEQI